MDATDRKILLALQAEGRITNAELAQRVGLSPPSVLERVKKLERAGVIRGYVALLEPALVGMRCFTYVEVSLARHGNEAVQRFVRLITRMDEVLECHHITGEADCLLKIATRDIPAYEELIRVEPRCRLGRRQGLGLLSRWSRRRHPPVSGPSGKIARGVRRLRRAPQRVERIEDRHQHQRAHGLRALVHRPGDR